ncbi:uncharacterized protein BXZ73DRAFT_91575 [Epithele typhae]|uniref:uncharacterized protein n=1 Tax=Epithele typhae TaxID=378194 RepID=UPI0020089D3C|nr:uncharacterized protein BXZ73DRAFT_91575 [Epithele typhae]KAH9922862.1 hypothetical protein BXZ73DRAFT_91575 [Epithele typhae]
MPGRHYSKFIPPSLDMSELVCQKLDNDATDMLIDKWLERPHRPDSYFDWFQRIREHKHVAHHCCREQLLLWNKGVFVPENIFTRTVDTGRLIPLDRTWVTHVYHHRSMKRLTMMPVIFSMVSVRVTSFHEAQLMLLRGMHDRGCDDIYVIVTDLKRHEMDQVADYFQYVCQNTATGNCKPSVERKINHDYILLSSALDRRTPCFPQIDLTLRALLHEKRPPFIVLFSHQTMSYSQILFAHPAFVPSMDMYHDFPSGCPNPGCTDNCCELIRFPKHGPEYAVVLSPRSKKKVRYRYGRRAHPHEMCNWIECDICFTEELVPSSGSEGSVDERSDASMCDPTGRAKSFAGLVCSRCKLVKYCSAEHQRLDWEEHRRVCIKSDD